MPQTDDKPQLTLERLKAWRDGYCSTGEAGAPSDAEFRQIIDLAMSSASAAPVECCRGLAPQCPIPACDGRSAIGATNGPAYDSALAACDFLLRNLDLEASERWRLEEIREYVQRAATGVSGANCPMTVNPEADAGTATPRSAAAHQYAPSSTADTTAVELLRRAMAHCHGNARRMREQFKDENGEALYAEAMQVVVDIQAYLRDLPSANAPRTKKTCDGAWAKCPVPSCRELRKCLKNEPISPADGGSQ